MNQRSRSLYLLIFGVSLLLGATLPPTTAQAQTDARCFSESSYCISGRIRMFWEQHGGLAVFGLPISPQQTETVEGRSVQVQWFERNRLELHPQNPAPFDVLLGRLGEDRLQQQGRTWQTFPTSSPQDNCLFFAETGHNICGSILAAWRANGLELDRRAGKSIDESLALFGLPLSAAQTETMSDGRQYTVQWFERARFEIHPENPPPFNVLLGLLGREVRGVEAESVPLTTVRFEAAGCPFNVPGGLNVECGYLTVPEDRRQFDGRTIQLAVAIVRTTSTNPAPDPLVYLSGGPGSPATQSTVSLARGFTRFLGNRDFIVFDQRGTGFSQPALTCPEVGQLNYDLLVQNVGRAEKVQAEAETLLRCRNQLADQGINLAAYNSAASAADLNDLRIALGYSQLNLLGISYGTRLALTAMRDYPEGIRSAVLDSAYPPQVNLYTEMPANANRAFTTLFRGCATDPACNAAYPDLERVFYDLVDQLNATPATVPVPNPRTGGTLNATFDGSKLVGVLFGMLYRTDIIPQLPRLIYATSNGDYTMLGQLESQRLGRQGGFSHGTYFSVQCSEEIPFATLDTVNATAAEYPLLQTFFSGIIENTPAIFDLCAGWGVNPPDPSENAPVHSDIPTLLLAGEYDPITPPAWGQLTAETLSTSFFYQFPGTGHAVITRGACPYGIIQSFLSNPTSAPDGTCAGGLSVGFE